MYSPFVFFLIFFSFFVSMEQLSSCAGIHIDRLNGRNRLLAACGAQAAAFSGQQVKNKTINGNSVTVLTTCLNPCFFSSYSDSMALFSYLPYCRHLTWPLSKPGTWLRGRKLCLLSALFTKRRRLNSLTIWLWMTPVWSSSPSRLVAPSSRLTKALAPKWSPLICWKPLRLHPWVTYSYFFLLFCCSFLCSIWAAFHTFDLIFTNHCISNRCCLGANGIDWYKPANLLLVSKFGGLYKYDFTQKMISEVKFTDGEKLGMCGDGLVVLVSSARTGLYAPVIHSLYYLLFSSQFHSRILFGSSCKLQFLFTRFSGRWNSLLLGCKYWYVGIFNVPYQVHR